MRIHPLVKIFSIYFHIKIVVSNEGQCLRENESGCSEETKNLYTAGGF